MSRTRPLAALRRQEFIADQEEQRLAENRTLVIAAAHAFAFENSWKAAMKALQAGNPGFAKAILQEAQPDLDALKACLPD